MAIVKLHWSLMIWSPSAETIKESLHNLYCQQEHHWINNADLLSKATMFFEVTAYFFIRHDEAFDELC